MKIYEKDNFVVFSVKNYGSYIDIENKEKVFDKFYRINSYITSETQGSGLGLYIAKNLINKSDRTNITSLKYSDGECERIFQNKQGFSEKRFKQIQENVQKVIDDGVNFLYELIRAQHSYNK